MPEPLILYRWWITDEITGKRRLTSFRMSEVDARSRYPDAEPDPASREERYGTAEGASAVNSRPGPPSGSQR
ncbi:hypothetical protein [Piscinibacter koreensis]|uniref:Uncharacterized protein n=1 Tax=Piscinibacter koreensis TaxID=2742824 RepID=A0A7Y6NQW5_9BURK|nr:hypothetical protein [Schlegelella koreensis]NUZ07673.1 hypothetical protein [Schlegelella koreensis]